MMERALVADDDALSREFLKEALQRLGLEVTVAKDGREALEQADKVDFDLVFTDLRMPRLDGTGLLKGLRQKGFEGPVVVATAYGTIESAVDAMRHGADDYLVKPLSVDQIEIVLEKMQARQRLEEENRYLRSQVSAESTGSGMVCASAAMEKVVALARRVADSNATVLLTGESGTGKEVVSRFIHESSSRKHGPYIKVNCAALSDSLLESELFGHEQGAFTGAIKKHKGRFELADGGTLLLDEISEIKPALQAKMLRVLEEEEFERVGGSRSIRIDVRIIATTNRDLEEEMKKGRFREDLFYRLNVVPIHLPPLRERREEIGPFAEHFLRRFARERGGREIRLDPSGLERLSAYGWPGNVRELKNVLQRVAILGSAAVLDRAHVDSVLGLACESTRPGSGAMAGGTLEAMEKEMILSTLERTSGRRRETAQILGITTRTLSNKLKIYRTMGTPVPCKRAPA